MVSAINSNLKKTTHSAGTPHRCIRTMHVRGALCPATILLLCSLIVPYVINIGAADEPKEHRTDRFVSDVFDGRSPEMKTLWLTKTMRQKIRKLLGHPFRSVRIRYWRQGTRFAFILHEIAKERPITTGIVVTDGRVERVDVLAYRETRGREATSESFLKQYSGAGLSSDQELDQTIDGISGATLSVKAITRQVRLSLFLYDQLRN